MRMGRFNLQRVERGGVGVESQRGNDMEKGGSAEATKDKNNGSLI